MLHVLFKHLSYPFCSSVWPWLHWLTVWLRMLLHSRAQQTEPWVVFYRHVDSKDIGWVEETLKLINPRATFSIRAVSFTLAMTTTRSVVNETHNPSRTFADCLHCYFPCCHCSLMRLHNRSDRMWPCYYSPNTFEQALASACELRDRMTRTQLPKWIQVGLLWLHCLIREHRCSSTLKCSLWAWLIWTRTSTASRTVYTCAQLVIRTILELQNVVLNEMSASPTISNVPPPAVPESGKFADPPECHRKSLPLFLTIWNLCGRQGRKFGHNAVPSAVGCPSRTFGFLGAGHSSIDSAAWRESWIGLRTWLVCSGRKHFTWEAKKREVGTEFHCYRVRGRAMIILCCDGRLLLSRWKYPKSEEN